MGYSMEHPIEYSTEFYRRFYDFGAYSMEYSIEENTINVVLKSSLITNS
jgi:hypothetical protein